MSFKGFLNKFGMVKKKPPLNGGGIHSLKGWGTDWTNSKENIGSIYVSLLAEADTLQSVTTHSCHQSRMTFR